MWDTDPTGLASEAGAAARPSLFLLAATGAAILCVAGALVILAHEVVGHGGAAFVQGYPLIAFYVSPIEGYAISEVPSNLSTAGWVFFRLGGPAAQMLLGLLALAALRRSRRLVVRMFFFYLALFSIVATFAYAAADLAFMAGGGDFAAVARLLGLPGPRLAVIAGIGGFWLTVRFGQMAHRSIDGFWPLPSYRQRFAALCLVFYPGMLLLVAYLAAVWRLLEPAWATTIALGQTMGLVVAGAASAVAAAFPGASVREETPPRASFVRALAASALALVGLLLVFGPTGTTARAVLVRLPADGWMFEPPVTNLDLTVSGDLEAAATFTFKIVAAPFPSGQASPIAGRIIEHLNRQPNAWAFYDNFAARNVKAVLDGTGARPVSRSVGRSIWVDGREDQGARTVTVAVALKGSAHLRADGGVYELRVGVQTVDPIDGKKRVPERIRIAAGPGLRVIDAAVMQGSRKTPLVVRSVLIWMPDAGDPPDALVVRFHACRCM